MSKEKIVSILDIKNLSYEFLSFKEHNVVGAMKVSEALFLSENRHINIVSNHKIVNVLVLLTLVHNQNVFLLQFMVLISDKKVSKNNLEVNL